MKTDTMNTKKNDDNSQKTKLLNLHSWSGIALGLLLYAVIFTGAVAVFADEIGQWSNNGKSQQLLLTADLDRVVNTLKAKTDPAYLEDIGLSESYRGELIAFFHTHKNNPQGQLDDYGIEYRIDPQTYQVTGEREGFGSDLFYSDDETALSRFLVAVHTELHLPEPWGLLLTGILGLAMLVAAVSGFMMHKQLFADIFLLRKRRNGQPLTRDLHAVAGTWGLPFAFILAFTGSFFSFAGAFGLPAMAMVAFGGDQEAMIRVLVDAPESDDAVAQPSTSINAMVRDSAERTRAEPRFVSLSHWDQSDAKVRVFYPPAEGGLEPKQPQYHGATGEFDKFVPLLGNQPSAGSALYSVIVPLHFGTFAGLLSKFVWLALGFAMGYVTLSGLALYAERKESEGPRWFSRSCLWMGCGLPLASIGAGIAYFASDLLSLNHSFWTPMGFVIAALGATLYALLEKRVPVLKQRLLLTMLVGLVLLPLARFMAGGPGWLNAIAEEQLMVVLVDLIMLLSAAYTLYLLRDPKPTVSTEEAYS